MVAKGEDKPLQWRPEEPEVTLGAWDACMSLATSAGALSAVCEGESDITLLVKAAAILAVGDRPMTEPQIEMLLASLRPLMRGCVETLARNNRLLYVEPEGTA